MIAHRHPEAVTTELVQVKSRDKYGRSVVQLDRAHVAADGRWVQQDRDLAVVVRMPRAWVLTYGTSYMVNVRNAQGPGTVTYWIDRKAALRHAELACM